MKDRGEQRNLAAESEAGIADLDQEILAIRTGASDDAVASAGDVDMDDARILAEYVIGICDLWP